MCMYITQLMRCWLATEESAIPVAKQVPCGFKSTSTSCREVALSNTQHVFPFLFFSGKKKKTTISEI